MLPAVVDESSSISPIRQDSTRRRLFAIKSQLRVMLIHVLSHAAAGRLSGQAHLAACPRQLPAGGRRPVGVMSFHLPNSRVAELILVSNQSIVRLVAAAAASLR